MTNPSAITAAQTALVLADFQPGILANLDDAAPLLARANKALACARESGVQVVYVRVAFTPEDYERIPLRNKTFAAVAQYKVFPADAPESQIHEALDVRDGDIVVRKTRFGAFSTTDLYAGLHARGIDTLIIGGVSTAGVVLSTLRDAADADFRLFVLSDVTADADPEVHCVLIEKVFPHQAEIITTDALAGLSRG